MKPLVSIARDKNVAFDIVAAPSHEDCLSLCRYFENHWAAEVVEIFDVGFAAKFSIHFVDRSVMLEHDSHTGNLISAEGRDVSTLIPDILADLALRLG